MPAQALYLKWRPATFEDVIGQDHITRTLRNALRQRRIRHAYLFSGPRGTGKTSTARLLAKAVNCQGEDPARRPCNECPHCVAVNEGRYLDLIEIDAASHTGVDDVRDLRDKIAFAPNEGRFKVYIIDEVHRFSGAAFDALLKTLEEPPPHAIFVLATTEPDRVPETVRSRCQRFDFGRIAESDMVARLKMALTDGMTAEDEALHMIAASAEGSMRDAWSLMDMCLGGEKYLSAENVRLSLGIVSQLFLFDYLDALGEADAGLALKKTEQLMQGGRDVQVFLRDLSAHLRQALTDIQYGRAPDPYGWTMKIEAGK